MAFSGRNAREILRDPLTFLFGILLPVVLMALMHALSGATGAVNPAFEIRTFSSGMAVFSLTFILLFSGMLVTGDRASAFLARLFSSPMTAGDYLLGYSLPVAAIGLTQAAVCLITALFFGLEAIRLPAALVALVPTVLFTTGTGLLFGTLLTDRQMGGVFPILINAATLLSGTWFPLNLIGGGFETAAYLLPFAHAVDAARLALEGNFLGALPHMGWVLLYAAAVYALAVALFRRRMRG